MHLVAKVNKAWAGLVLLWCYHDVTWCDKASQKANFKEILDYMLSPPSNLVTIVA